MFIANLLSFYEQLLVYEKNKDLAKEYNIEKPLWIFVGTTVTGREEESDVIRIVEFVNRVISDDNWVKKWISDILKGNTVLKDEEGKDIFQDRFIYLRTEDVDYEDLYRRVFGGKGSLKLYEIKNAQGEIGLKIGDNEYFGVINIGNVSDFKKQLEKKGISVEQDAISGSLFDNIKREDSKINLLIGSKKFIEGWDTWRVSSMGLLNIGEGQGPQIIQLFGRGVRLKGKGMSLKRSGDKPEIRILETLNIYGIKADYLSKFLESIRKDEVEFETIKIPVQLQHKDKWESLYTLNPRSEKKFEEEEILRLYIDDSIYYTIDLLPKVSMYLAEDRKEDGLKAKSVKPVPKGLRFSEDIIDFLDWGRIWQEVNEFKVQRNYWNLVFGRDMLKNILLSGKYKIFAPDGILNVKKIEDIKRVEDIALLVIKKYIDLFYRKSARRFETKNLHYRKFEQLPLPFISDIKQGYIVQVDKQKKELIEKIRNLANNLEGLIKEDTATLPRVYFDRSLYVPILLQSGEIDKLSPAGLVESEQKFVKDLKRYLETNQFPFEVYLLRNYPFSGAGFQLQWAGFYPDFIMWVKEGGKQIIVFIDPKGLEHSRGLDDEKIQFAKEIKAIQNELGGNIILESFILSNTSYSELVKGMLDNPQQVDYENNHVLFLDDEDWPEKLFKLLSTK